MPAAIILLQKLSMYRIVCVASSDEEDLVLASVFVLVLVLDLGLVFVLVEVAEFVLVRGNQVHEKRK